MTRLSRFVLRLALAVITPNVLVAASAGADETSTSYVDPKGNTFTYDAPGDLIPDSGTGLADSTIYLEGIRFPIEEAPAYPNSQVYNDGGMYGEGGSQCDASNYAYPWRDDFCESRSYDVQMCPSGEGHQGQDIRPQSCDKATYWAVATEDGQITSIGDYTVTLTGNSGTVYRYMHMQMDQLAVAVGDNVTRGQHMGLVSDNFGDSSTTIHLHFDVKQNVLVDGTTTYTYVPPYASLVDAYERLLSGSP